MPYTAGIYAAPANSWNPAVAGSAINATDWAALLADLTTALSACVLKDGTQTITANLPMGGFKLTGLAAGSAAGNSVRWEQTGPGILTTTGDVMYASSANTPARLAIGAADLPLVVNAGATAPQWGFANKTANTVYAGPSSGAAAAPAFRALVPADLSMTPITASLGGDVALNNTGNYFDGPSVAQGTSGTWFVSGSILVDDTAGAANISVKLWDGTTVIASTSALLDAINSRRVVALSGFITSPAGNLRMSAKDLSSTSGKISFNASGNSKDSTITAIRIA